MNPYAWKPIPDGPIVLDFSHHKDRDDFHSIISRGFGFPACYGENWDALWDFLDDFAMGQKNERIVILKGTENLSRDMTEYLAEAIPIFRELEEAYPLIRFTVLRSGEEES